MSSTIYFSIALSLHILSAVIWIGGMFFAHFALRPVATRLLEPPLRLPLMSQILTRFFPWVWASVVLLWATGFWMHMVGIYIHIMMTIAAVMTVIFVYIFFLPFPSLKQAVADKNFPKAGKHLARIRHLIHLNLWLGVLTIIVGTAGRLI